MATALKIVPPADEAVNKMFRDGNEILEVMLQLNRDILGDPGFTKEAVLALGSPPECPPSDEHHLHCLMLFPSPADLATDLRRYWRAFSAVHGSATKWDLLDFENFDPQRLKLHGASAPPGPHWAVVELGRSNRGTPVNDAVQRIRMGRCFPLGPEILLVGAVHPAWVEALNGAEYPFLNAAGIEVHPGRFEDAEFYPHLARSGNHPILQVEAWSNMSRMFGTGTVSYTAPPS